MQRKYIDASLKGKFWQIMNLLIQIIEQDDWMLIDDSQKPSLNHTESLLRTIKGKQRTVTLKWKN